jgi:hypothetical protein
MDSHAGLGQNPCSFQLMARFNVGIPILAKVPMRNTVPAKRQSHRRSSWRLFQDEPGITEVIYPE